MKILNTSHFVLERAKVKPITNAEWEQVKQDISQKALGEDSLPLRQGDIVHVTYRDRHYMVITDPKLLRIFGLLNLSSDYIAGGMMSFGGRHTRIQSMKLSDYIGADFKKTDREFDIIDVWRPENTMADITEEMLQEDNIKIAVGTNQYRKIYTRN